jgi:hypothetical protein
VEYRSFRGSDGVTRTDRRPGVAGGGPNEVKMTKWLSGGYVRLRLSGEFERETTLLVRPGCSGVHF